MTRRRRFVWHGVWMGTMAAGGFLAFAQHGGGTVSSPVQHSGGGTAGTPSGQHSGGPMTSSAQNGTVQNGSLGNPGQLGNTQDYSMDEMSRRNLEEKRGKMMNSERQRMMVKEANQLVQTTAELETSVEQGSQGAARDEAMRRADQIEKLAHNVKERMKGAR